MNSTLLFSTPSTLRRIWPLLLLLLGVAPTVAQPVAVGLSSETVAAGQTQDVRVPVSDVTGRGILAFSFTLTTDATVAEFAGVEVSGTLASDWTVLSNAVSPGELRVSGAGTAPLAGSGTLVRVRVRGVAVGSAPLAWAAMAFNEGDPEAAPVDGSLSVTTPTDAEAPPEAGRLRVWPNPTMGHLWVEAPCGGGGSPLQVVDVRGRVVRERTTCGTVGVGGLAPGRYVVRVGQAARPVVVVR